MGIGTRLKQIIKEINMTIKQLAEITGIPVNTLYSIVKRDSDRVRANTIQALADALGVTPTYLIGFDEKIVNPEQYSHEDLASIKAGAWASYQEHDINLDDVDIAFYGGYKELSESDKEILRDMVRVMLERRKNPPQD